MPSPEPVPTDGAATLREQLRHVYWIGGGSCAGKSAIARRLADGYGLHLYPTDDRMAEHARRSHPRDTPFLQRFLAMQRDDRWVNRSPAAMLDTFPWFRGEAFSCIVEDLLGLPPHPPVIVEGFRLLPRCVKPLLSAVHQAVWLLPSPEFRRAVLDGRAICTSGFLAQTGNPQRALRNLLERDGLFTDRLRKEIAGLHLHAIEVDTAIAEDDSANLVANRFRLRQS